MGKEEESTCHASPAQFAATLLFKDTPAKAKTCTEPTGLSFFQHGSGSSLLASCRQVHGVCVMAITGVPAKMRVMAHAMQTHSRNQQSFCCHFARQRRWGEAWVASHKVTGQFFHWYRCTKPSLCKAVGTDQPSGLTAIPSPPVFVVQLYPVPGLW